MTRLTAEQKLFYKENGYIVLKKLMSDEDISTISKDYDELFKRKNQEKMESSWVGSDENDRKSDSSLTVSVFLNNIVDLYTIQKCFDISPNHSIEYVQKGMTG